LSIGNIRCDYSPLCPKPARDPKIVAAARIWPNSIMIIAVSSAGEGMKETAEELTREVKKVSEKVKALIRHWFSSIGTFNYLKTH